MPRFLFALLFVILHGQGPAAPNHLADNIVLIVRHAEKPEQGSLLTPRGEARAAAYVSYFEPFHEGELKWRVDALYAGADSDNSLRPRLTLEPIAKATKMPLNISYGTKDPDGLVHELEANVHGAHPLICWRHGQIPALLKAFGASPKELLPGGAWPDEVYDWVIVLRFDGAGKLVSQTRLVEHLQIATP